MCVCACVSVVLVISSVCVWVFGNFREVRDVYNAHMEVYSVCGFGLILFRNASG